MLLAPDDPIAVTAASVYEQAAVAVALRRNGLAPAWADALRGSFPQPRIKIRRRFYLWGRMPEHGCVAVDLSRMTPFPLEGGFWVAHCGWSPVCGARQRCRRLDDAVLWAARHLADDHRAVPVLQDETVNVAKMNAP